MTMGAVARQGVERARKAKPARVPPKRSAATRAREQLTADERAVIDAWTAYARAAKQLLKATGAVTPSRAEERVRVVQAKLDGIVRENRRSSQSKKPGPVGGRSTSVRAVSGGAPGLGRRR